MKEKVQKKYWEKPQLIAISVKNTLGGNQHNQGGGKGKGTSGPIREAS